MIYGALGENALASEQEAASGTGYTNTAGLGALGSQAIGQQGDVTSLGFAEAAWSATGVAVAAFAGASLATSTLTAAGVASGTFAAVFILNLAKAITQSQTVLRGTLSVNHTNAITQTMTVIASYISGFYRTFAATNAMVATIIRGSNKFGAATLAQTVIVKLGAGKIVSATLGQTISLTRLVTKLIAAIQQLVFSTTRVTNRIFRVTMTRIVQRSGAIGVVSHAVSSMASLLVSVVRPSAVRYWPSDVSSTFTLEGYSEVSEDNVRQFTPEVGYPKTRRKTSNSTEIVTGSILMTSTEYVAFDVFFRDTIKDGVNSFNMLHPRTQATARMKFVEAPKIQDFGVDLWRVNVKLRRTENTVVTALIPPSATYAVEPRTDALGSMAFGQSGTVRSI